MAHDNAFAVNIECEKTTTTSLLDLNDLVLLRVFRYLNLRDSIHFAGTSKRLKSVGGMHFIKYKQISLRKYEQSEVSKQIPIETLLFHIGHQIKTLAINSMRPTVAKAVMDNCVNVTTLKMYDCDGTNDLKKWLQQLKLESLTIYRCRDFNEMSVGLATLKELNFINDVRLNSMHLTKILEKTTELETLTLSLMNYLHFDYGIFTKLPKLQSLDIKTNSANLANLVAFLKLDVLTQLKLDVPYNSAAKGLPRLNSFLEILTERSKIHELKLDTTRVDQNTFRIVKSLHVSSLKFFAFIYGDRTRDERWMVHQLVEALPNLKRLDFMTRHLQIEIVDIVVKSLVKLETFAFRMQTIELEQLDELRITEMMKTSTSRPMLSLYINSGGDDAVKIELQFEQRKHRIVQ